VEYTNFEPPEPGPDGPSKRDLLTQIEADHYAARQRDDEAAMAVLDERYERVSNARSAAAARKAYAEHVAAAG
jgi:hypothetical protein